MFRKNLRLISACGVVLLAAMTAGATGPIEQVSSISGIPRLLSHVQVRNTGGKGSGTIIDKHVDADGNAWVCVLTADHVVRGSTGHLIDIGSGASLNTFGGADSWYLSNSATTRGRDIAVLGVKIGNINSSAAAAAAYNGISPVNLRSFGADYNPAAPTSISRTIFTEHGYGRQGSFVDGGMTAGVFSTGIRRFQNNQIERWVRNVDATYDYRAVQWDFNIPSDAGPLLTEGLSYVGDSGGGYTVSQLETKTVINAFRQNVHQNADGTGPLIPEVPAMSQLGLWVDDLIAVHTLGNSSTAGLNRFTTYNADGTPNVHTWGAAVPMTADMITWVNDACAVIPSPSAGTLLALGLVAATPRRRR